jgi:Restriction endonuclease
MKRIAPAAYDALVDALAVVFWNKQPFERCVRLALLEHPEVLESLTFSDPKRQVASDLVMRLAENEARYQPTTLSLMLQLSAMEDFPNLKAQPDGVERLDIAEAAVSELRKWTGRYSELAKAQEALAADRAAEASRSEHRRTMASILQDLEQRFISMHGETDHQKRGRAFEQLLNELFGLFDLNPRKSFTLADEQVDGAFTFNTDDYLLEAKWEASAASREDVDVLAQKVQRKGKNTLGLFIAVSGFSVHAVSAHSNCGTSLVFMDGADLVSILHSLITLTDALEAKRRHLSETGLPLLLVRDMTG